MQLKGLTMISKNQMLRKQTQNKPKRTQNEPNHKKAKNDRNFCYNEELRRNAAINPPKKQTQTNPTCRGVASGEAGTNPIIQIFPA